MSNQQIASIELSPSARSLLDGLFSKLRPFGCESGFFAALPMPGKDFSSLIVHNNFKAASSSKAVVPETDDLIIQKSIDWHYPFVLKSMFHEVSPLAKILKLGENRKELLIVPIVSVPKFHGIGLIPFTRSEDRACYASEESLAHEVKFAIGAAIDTAFAQLNELSVLPMTRKGELTPREREIVTFCALGNTSSEIAMQINLTERTVNAHIQNACKKLAAQNKAECVLQAIRYRQIGPGAGMGFYQVLTEIFSNPYDYNQKFA
ncbi:MAG: LuxR C-terminal-related transcriptional regulator [Rickettsiales bacterium]|nr:LuxR C-terminal-related transcriptional regulator [Rickettsiales bacterium]